MRRIVWYQIDFSFDREHDSSKDWFPYNETDKGVNNYLTQISISSPFSISTGIFSNQNFMIYLRKKNIFVISISGRNEFRNRSFPNLLFFISKIVVHSIKENQDESLVYSSSSHEMVGISPTLHTWDWYHMLISHPLTERGRWADITGQVQLALLWKL